MDLDGRVALVTGASRGVGAATAAGARRSRMQRGVRGAFHQRVAAAYSRYPRRNTRARDGIGGTGLAVPTNLSDRDAVREMVRQTVEHFGGIDILINNAAVTFIGDFDQPEHRHELTFAVNYWAPYIAMKEAYPHMEERGGGSIVNVSSLAALMPFPDNMSYGTSKVALERLTLDAARVLHPKRIAANVFRIDVAVASEGFVANTPGADRSDWEPCDVAAEGILWMVRQPVDYTGRRESMYHLREREGIMASRAARPRRLAGRHRPSSSRGCSSRALRRTPSPTTDLRVPPVARIGLCWSHILYIRACQIAMTLILMPSGAGGRQPGTVEVAGEMIRT